MSDIAQLVDRFVETLNQKSFVSVLADQVPNELRTGELSPSGDPLWQISLASNHWVETLESVLTYPLPTLYRSLIACYRFDEFEVGPILFLANTGADTSERFLSNKGMAPALLSHGLLQFGRAAGGSYDPICFEMQRRSKTDAPIVRVDHEHILVRGDRIRIVQELAPSFRKFIQHVIAGEFKR